MAHETLPRDARLIALLLAASPSVADAQPAVLTQLLEFAHRYTTQVLSDGLVYAEHAGRKPEDLNMDDMILAVQSRVGWEFGGRMPKEHIMSLAERTNAIPLDPIPETFGVRLPPAKHCLTGINFDLVPNKKLQSNASDGDEEEDDDDDDDDRMDEEAGSRVPSEGALAVDLDGGVRMEEDENDSNGSADDDPDGLFDDDGDEEEGEMALVDIDALNGLVGMAGPQAGEKRKVNPEDDDYDE